MIVAAMATTPGREAYLAQAVASLRPQVDTLRVYLNNFHDKPPFLADDEVIFSSEAAGELGAEGKFYWFNQLRCNYYLTVDDDLLYPPDYAQRLISAYEIRRRLAVVGVHGFVFSKTIESYVYSRQEKYKCTRGLARARPVHVIGTGTAILHPETIVLPIEYFLHRNAADLQLAIAAQRQHVPMVVIARPASWIKELLMPSNSPGIWSRTKAEGGIKKARLARSVVEDWHLFPDPAEQHEAGQS